MLTLSKRLNPLEKKMNDTIGNLLQEILKEKFELESKNKKPRLILISEKIFEILNTDWIESVQELPWGETLVYEIEKQRKINRNIFLADGSLFGLWVVRVNTIDGFKVY